MKKKNRKRSNVSNVNRYDLCTFDYVHTKHQREKNIETSYSIYYYVCYDHPLTIATSSLRSILFIGIWKTKEKFGTVCRSNRSFENNKILIYIRIQIFGCRSAFLWKTENAKGWISFFILCVYVS